MKRRHYTFIENPDKPGYYQERTAAPVDTLRILPPEVTQMQSEAQLDALFLPEGYCKFRGTYSVNAMESEHYLAYVKERGSILRREKWRAEISGNASDAGAAPGSVQIRIAGCFSGQTYQKYDVAPGGDFTVSDACDIRLPGGAMAEGTCEDRITYVKTGSLM